MLESIPTWLFAAVPSSLYVTVASSHFIRHHHITLPPRGLLGANMFYRFCSSPSILLAILCLHTHVFPSCAAPSTRNEVGNLASMDSTDFSSFAREINLSEEDEQVIKSQFGNPETQSGSLALDVACLTTKLAIGAAQVSFLPVNQTLAAENW